MKREEIRNEFNYIKRIVIKIGSSLVVNPQKHQWEVQNIENLINGIRFLKQNRKEVILVSSGAVALGKIKLKNIHPDYQPSVYPTLPRKQALASIGQIELMKFYENQFSQYDMGISQILITAKDFRDRETYLNIGHTIQEILKLNLIPVINENDTVSTEELKFGDNDFLSAATAVLLHSQILILLTSVEGFIVNGQRISLLEKIDANILRYAKGPDGYGSGGMLSKIRVGKLCLQAGLHVAILPGNVPDVIKKFFSGEDIGTLIYSVRKEKYLKARKKWLLFARTKGTIVIDKGAEEALRKRGSSLLLAGIKQIEGSFSRGDVVEIKNIKHQIIGRGIVNFSSRVLRERLSDSNSINTIGNPAEVIHRNDLIIEE